MSNRFVFYNAKRTGTRKNVPVFLYGAMLAIILTAVSLGTPLFAQATQKEQDPVKEEVPAKKPILPWSAPEINVSGVMVMDGESYAIIGDDVAKAGDFVNGYKVISITNEEVTLDYNGKVFTKSLKEPAGKKSILGLGKDADSKEGANIISDIKDRVAEIDAIEIIKKTPAAKIMNPEKFDKLAVRNLKSLFYSVGIIHLWFALCLYRIAKKAGSESAWIAILPIANIFLMFNIAGRSYLLMFLLLVPVVNIVIMALVSVGIAEACSRPGWLGLLMFVPAVNFFVLGYLAFCK